MIVTDYSDIKNDTMRMEQFESLEMVLHDILDNSIIPNTSELLGIYGRLVVNGFNILDCEMNSIGTGIYLGVSVTDHSCAPNAIATFEGKTLHIRALEDMPSIDWTKIFISYIDTMAITQSRRDDLKCNYYFLCMCPKCIDPKTTISMISGKCQSCKNPIYLEENPTDCMRCGWSITEKYKETFYDVLEFTSQQIEKMKQIACNSRI